MIQMLVDHGCGNVNLGDIGQLQGVLNVFGARPGIEVTLRRTPCDERLELFSNQRVMETFEVIRWDSRRLSNLPLVWRFQRVASLLESAWNMRSAASGRWKARLGRAQLPLREIATRYDRLHLVGGGYLTDSFAASLVEKCALIHAFSSEGKPIVLSGQQIGPFRSDAARKCVYDALKRATFVGLREPGESADHCRAAGIAEGKFAVIGDDSFGMTADHEGAKIFLQRFGLVPKKFIAINFRSANYAGTSSEDLDRFATCVSQVQAALRMPLVFVPISMASGDSDFQTGLRLREKMGSDAFVLADRSTSAQVAKGILGLSRGAIGSSYHFCTFARSLGCRVVAIGSNPYYRQKAEGMERLWQSGVRAVSLADLDTPERVEKIITWFGEFGSRTEYVENTDWVNRWRERMVELVGG